ncbi:MAG TPA: hypothetical protein VN880_01830, partial [Solirubrobacteraceae bacterium]|nr:hypothetical protein [Solirubrobacteraceae bacterium]
MATTTTETRTVPTETRIERGVSFARGPALILGTILLAAGLYSLYKEHTFPPFSNFPNGDAPVQGKVIFSIFGVNGWTGELTAVAGGLLLFGAAQHLLAKTVSLIVGVALGAAAVIALISGNVLGLAAANGWTKLAWAVSAAILLLNTLIPRRRTEVPVDGAPVYEDGSAHRWRRGRGHTAVAAGTGAAAGAAYEHHRDKEHYADDDRVGAEHSRDHDAERDDVGDRPRHDDVGDRPRHDDVGDRPRDDDVGDRPRDDDVGDRPRDEDVGDRPRDEDVGDRP